MAISGNAVTLTRRARPKEPGYTIGTFPKAVQEAFLKEYRAKYPEGEPELNPAKEEAFVAPRDYSDQRQHFRNFIECVRERKQPVEDAVFGFRAAGPALLSNISYFENRPVAWDPEAMKIDRVGPLVPRAVRGTR